MISSYFQHPVVTLSARVWDIVWKRYEPKYLVARVLVAV